MDVTGKRVVVIGAYGEVGQAVCREILFCGAKDLIVTSLRKEETQQVVTELATEAGSCALMPFYGNVFVRRAFKDIPPGAISKEQDRTIVNDNLAELNEEILTESSLYGLIMEYQPEIIVDCINTATVLAYRNVYRSYEELLERETGGSVVDADRVYNLLSALAIPPLVRHIQILYEAMKRAGTLVYLKVGTTGTGGMGVNIPFTHGEEAPSRLLMSKAAMAGAHTMLLYALSQAPGFPIVKEIKPAAMIGWKRIGNGPIMRRGKPLSLYDCPPAAALRLSPGSTFTLSDPPESTDRGIMRGIYVDTGENGWFTSYEFQVISALGLMEFVTPEEIAHTVVQAIQGIGNGTSRDVLEAIGGAVMGPSYRAGVLRHNVIESLECADGESRVCYGLAGPQMSKLLFEAHLLKQCYGSMRRTLEVTSEEISLAMEQQVSIDSGVRSEAISIGIPVLLSDGERLLAVKRPGVDMEWEEKPWLVKQGNIDKWASRGWIDLRPANMAKWQERFRMILEEADACAQVNSSKFDRGAFFWSRPVDDRAIIDPAEAVSWVLLHECRGGRQMNSANHPYLFRQDTQRMESCA
jgi:hypothetical protein